MVAKASVRKKVLIADISPTVRRLMHGFLKEEFLLVEAENGKELLAHLDELHDCDSHCVKGLKSKDTHQVPARNDSCLKKDLDIIVMGYELSDCTALEITKDIRKRYHKLCLPIILSTSNNDRDTIIKALDTGVNDVIVKPFPRELLISKIRKQEHAMSAENMKLSETIADIPFFNGVPVSQVSYMLHTCGELKTLEKGDLVCLQNEDNHNLFILLDGKCEVVYNGRRVAEIEPVETVGEMGFVDDASKRSATVAALVKSEVYVLNKEKMDLYLNEERAISETILKNIIFSLNSRIRKSNAMVNKLKVMAEEYLAD
jgi:CheY-like chemotaxis protein